MEESVEANASEKRIEKDYPSFVTGNQEDIAMLWKKLGTILELTGNVERQNGNKKSSSESIGDDILRVIHGNLTGLMDPQNINEGEFNEKFNHLTRMVALASSGSSALRDFNSNQWKYEVLIAGAYLEKLLILTGLSHNYDKNSLKVAKDVLEKLADQGGEILIDKDSYYKKLRQARETGILQTAESLLNYAIKNNDWDGFFDAEKLLLQTSPFQTGIEFTSIGIERWGRLLETSAKSLPIMLDAAIGRQIEMLSEQCWSKEAGRRVFIYQLITRAKVTNGTNKELISQLEHMVKELPL